MNESIDLGRKSEYGEPCCMPSKDSDKVYYPEFNYSGDKELDLPDEGTMTIKFRVSRESEDKKEGRYHCTVEVISIENVEGGEEVEAPTKSGSESSDALDAIARQLVSLHNKLEETD